MKRLLIPLVISFLSLCYSTSSVNAQPYYGAELTYLHHGGNDYLVTLTYYRNCEYINAPQNVVIAFTCSTNVAYNFSSTLQRVAGTGSEISGVCSQQNTRCSSGTLFGIEKYVYQGIVQLLPCGKWTMAFSASCRLPSNTIQSPICQSAWISSTLYNGSISSNSSPTFTNNPILIMPTGQSTCYNDGAYDPDGDSLAYSLIAPMTTYSTPLIYLSPYSATQPVVSVPPVSIHPETGEICMTPISPVITVMAIKVEEWRKINGMMTLVGTVIRDMSLQVVSSNWSNPTLSGIDTSLSSVFDPNDTLYHTNICLGSTTDFTIKGHDEDTFNQFDTGSPEIFRISWNNGIPGASFNTYNNNTDSAYARFTWTPIANDLYDQQHCFTAVVKDSACPYYGMQSFAYCFKVKQADSIRIAGPDTICLNHTVTLSADSGFTSYQWSTGDTGQTIQVVGNVLGQGLHWFTVTGSDGICESSTGHNLYVDECTGIGPGKEIRSFTLYPNPGSGRVHVGITGYEGRCTIEVVDVCGKLLYRESFLPQDGASSRQLNLENLSPGIYLVRLLTRIEIQQEALILQ